MQNITANLVKGHNWNEIPWLLEYANQSINGCFVLCGNCSHVLGFMYVSRSLSATPQAIYGEDVNEWAPTLATQPVMLNSSLLLDQVSEEELTSTGTAGRRSEATPEQQKEMEENLRILDMKGDLVKGDYECHLFLPPQFDRFSEFYYAERPGLYREHSRFAAHISSLEGLLGLDRKEINYYKAALETPEGQAAPDAYQETLSNLRKWQDGTLVAYQRVKKQGDQPPTQPYHIESAECDPKNKVSVACPACKSANSVFMNPEPLMQPDN